MNTSPLEQRFLGHAVAVREDSQLIAEAATAWFELPSEQEIYASLADYLRQVVGEDVIISVSELGDQTVGFIPKVILGLDPVIDKLSALLGKHPIDMSGTFPATVQVAMAKGCMIHVDGGVTELASELISPFVCSQVVRLLGLSDAFVVGFARGRFAGGICLVTRPDTTLRQSTIEALARMAAAAIERIRSAEALRESEDKFRHLFEYSVTGKAVVLPTGEVTVNRALCEMLGYAPGELDSASWSKLTHPDDVAASVRERDAVLSGKKLYARLEKRFLRKDGSILWVDLSSSLRRDAGGKPLYLVTTIIDITQRKQTDQALRASERNLTEAQRLAKIGSWEWVVATDTVTWSEELFRINRRDPGLGTPRLKDGPRFYTTDSFARLNAATRSALETGAPFELELESVLPDGTKFWTVSLGEAECDASGQITKLRGTVQDITQRKLAEQASMEKLEELRRWHAVTLGRETRMLELKREINELLTKSGQPARYPSAEGEKPG